MLKTAYEYCLINNDVCSTACYQGQTGFVVISLPRFCTCRAPASPTGYASLLFPASEVGYGTMGALIFHARVRIPGLCVSKYTVAQQLYDHFLGPYFNEP